MDTLARYSSFSSTELVSICADSKDERAWLEFIQRFHTVIASAVLRTARMWCEPTRAHLDDLIQDTYLKLCENDNRLLRSFQPHQEDSIYGFLKVVAANVVHDHFKAAQAAKRGANQTEAIIEVLYNNPALALDEGFSTVSRRLQLEQIDKVLCLVTAGKDQDKKRAIFWLRHRQGLSAKEIAQIPGMELTTEGVESVLLRLATLIRTHFEDSSPHREVKVLPRKNRSKNKRQGT